MRAPSRSPMPDLDFLLKETNLLLASNGLPTCHSLAPVADGDTANPNAIAYSSERRYVVKVTQRHPHTLNHQLHVANALRDIADLPIPQHYCCATKGSRLPLMIMEWLPGAQLRTVLASAEHDELRKLCASLASCLATFHHPDHLTLVPKAEGQHSGWLYTQTLEALQNVAGKPSHRTGALDGIAVRRFLDARLPALNAPAIPSLQKADQDLRDFLADPTGFEITGMLDWEQVTGGDGVFAIALFFFRLWLNAKLAGWETFTATYNRLATVEAEQCPQVEFYLMCRAVLAYRSDDRAKELVDLLLQGHRLPFESERARR
ncbi:MAG: aminoglycoside phosphotransferase family protein [Gammaproteobacteria bacterium]|nr:aminoglycoside phosphotransferase family protein [Gammaproteobacteria bacterium]